MKRSLTGAVVLVLSLLAMSSATLAAPTKEQLQARFEQRYPAIRAAKAAGTVGETSRGLLETVKRSDDSAINRLVDQENADRQALYGLIAGEEGTSADLVARRAAKRNFERAKSGEWLKFDGEWKQK